MSEIIAVGEVVRSHDFPADVIDQLLQLEDGAMRRKVEACYIEGTVEAIETEGWDCARLKIRIAKRVWMGVEMPVGEGEYAYPPQNGIRTILGGVTAGVVKIEQ